jgi:hypothetical protein
MSALALLALSACGTRGTLVRLENYDQVSPERLRELKRTEGAAAAAALVPPPEAAPRRKDNVDDGIMPRGQDPFDLPPAGTAAPAPDPSLAPPPPPR